MVSRLFVGNLPYSCGEEEMKAIFDRWTVVEARVVTDRETGRSRGFGFVQLDTEEAARAAVTALDGSDYQGRPLAIREAHDRPARSDGPRRGGPPPRGDDRRRGPNGPPRDRGPGPAVERRPNRGPRADMPAAGPPPNLDPWSGEPAFDDGGKDGRRKRREKKKRERHEPDW